MKSLHHPVIVLLHLSLLATSAFAADDGAAKTLRVAQQHRQRLLRKLRSDFEAEELAVTASAEPLVREALLQAWMREAHRPRDKKDSYFPAITPYWFVESFAADLSRLLAVIES